MNDINFYIQFGILFILLSFVCLFTFIIIILINYVVSRYKDRRYRNWKRK